MEQTNKQTHNKPSKYITNEHGDKELTIKERIKILNKNPCYCGGC